MALFGRRPVRPSRSLTASAQRVTRENATDTRRVQQNWQERALAAYGNLGEIWFSGQFYARPLSKLRLFAAELDEEGNAQPSENEQLKELWDRVQDPGGGRSVMTGNYGRLRFLTGECFLVCSRGEDDEEQWEILSMAELKVTTEGGYTRRRGPGLALEELKRAPDGATEPAVGEAIVYRFWQRDPIYSQLADAPMRGVLELCDELTLLTRAVHARATSRLSGPGVLLVSEQISPAPVDAAPDEDPMNDPFFADFYRNTMAAIADPGSAAAAIPLIIRVPHEMVEGGMKLIKFGDPAEQYQEQGQRVECIKRIATGLDFPPEQLLGLTESNHWTGWIVDENTWKAHQQPVAQSMVDDFGSAYLRPAAEAAGIPNWESVVVGYDAADVLNHPDRAKDAKDLHDRIAISDASLRDAAGFDDDDAPDKNERAERVGIKVRDSSLAWYGIPSPRSGGLEPAPGEIVSGEGIDSAPAGPTSGAEVEPGPPAEPSAVVTASAAIDVAELVQVAQLRGAAELAVERAREVAGSRLRTKAKACGDCQLSIDGAANGVVAHLLGPDQVRSLAGGSERDLVKGAAGTFVSAAARFGIGEEWALELADLVEVHAARTLYELEAPALPAAFGALARRAQPHLAEEPLVPA